MLRTGLPKGRLLPRSEAAVVSYDETAPDVPAHHRFLRMPDIPDLVAEGLLDVGIAGEEWLVDSGADVVRVAPLGWYHVRICALRLPGGAPPAGPVRVVSEYPHIARDFARARWGEDHTVRTVRGSVEHYLPDLADVAVECVETGESMRRRGLVATETLFSADVWMVCSRETAHDDEVMDRLRLWAEAVALPAPGRSAADEHLVIPPGTPVPTPAGKVLT
ncbi:MULTISPECIES: hypothetical protein [unclassified Streptomyces]|uniref:hypothetical protein n=1 Tax=unclassified Streptomyces TaxID=2593676 RepID=UPI0037FE7A28